MVFDYDFGYGSGFGHGSGSGSGSGSDGSGFGGGHDLLSSRSNGSTSLTGDIVKVEDVKIIDAFRVAAQEQK